MSYDPTAPDLPEGGPPPRSQAGERVKVPAILLIVVGCINLLVCLANLGYGAYLATLPPDEYRKAVLEIYEPFMPPDVLKEMKKQMEQAPPDQAKIQNLGSTFGCGCVSLLAAALTIFGGIQMYKVRSYALAISGAIAAAIPCVTCSGTCCFGEAVGIWAVVVLMNEEVRRAFQ
jgi:hypothetical protein